MKGDGKKQTKSSEKKVSYFYQLHKENPRIAKYKIDMDIRK